MTAQEKLNYDSGVRRAAMFLKTDGIPKTFKIEPGYGIAWTTQAGVAKSGRIASIDAPMYKEGFMSVLAQSQNAMGNTSGLPLEVAATNAPVSVTEVKGAVGTVGVFDDIAGTANNLPKWLLYVIMGVAGWWFWKKVLKRRL